MKENLIIKILVSIPVVLVFLYFIPFLGICLLLFRFFVYGGRKNILTTAVLAGFGFLILIPKMLLLLKIDISKIAYLGKFVNSNLYKVDFIKYSKFLITLGIVFLILTVVFNRLFTKFGSLLGNYIKEIEKQDREIREENNLKIQEKQEKAKHTSYVRCPYCGSDNLLTERTGVCKFCRRTIENKNY